MAYINPFMPQNAQDLQAAGLMNLGLNMLAASGPTPYNVPFGARLGQAGLNTMQSIMPLGAQVRQQQMQQQQMQQRQALADRMGGYARQQTMGSPTAAGPLDPQTSLALDLAQESILSGKMPDKWMAAGLMPGLDKEGKITKSDRIMYLARRMSQGTATKEEEQEYDLLIAADPLTQLKRQIMKGYGNTPTSPAADPFGLR